MINVLFDFFTTCHWSNKTLIELNPKTNYVPLMFCSTFDFFRLGKVRFGLVRLGWVRLGKFFFFQKRDLLIVKRTQF